MVNLIAISAVAKNNVIGNDGEIPWDYPDDIEHFKRTVSDKPLLVGRKSYHSFYTKYTDKPIFVVTRDREYTPSEEQSISVHSKNDAFQLFSALDINTVFVLGGSQIYSLFFDDLSTLIISEIDNEYQGDTFFPEYDTPEWIETNRDTQYTHFDIVTYQRKNNK